MFRIALILSIVLFLVSAAFATNNPPTTTTTLPPSGGDVTCTNSHGPVSVATACSSLNQNDLEQVCRPSFEANSFQMCKPKVDAEAEAYCGVYVNNRVAIENAAICGDALQFCQSKDLYFSLSQVKNSCRQAQEQAQEQSASCQQSADNSYTASLTCEQATQTVSQAVNLTCPDVEAVCAKQVVRYRKRVLIDPLTHQRTKVFDTITKCVKWAKPTVNFSY